MLTSAVDKAAAEKKLGDLITQGRATAANVIEHVMNNQPTDRIATGGGMTFAPDHEKKSITVMFPTGIGGGLTEHTTHSLHRNALGQMAATLDMPMKFVDGLTAEGGEWGRELLAHNLQTVFHERLPKKRYLTRAIGGEVRGFLSDHYRRLDSRPIVESFATAVQAKGALPYAGYVTDTKISIQAVMPELYEPIPGEIVAAGLSLENSDYGNGALSVRFYLLRIWCANMAIMQDTMRQIHLGKRLDDSIIYSQKTYELDSQATVSALKDVVAAQFDHKSLAERMDAVRVANEQEVTSAHANERLKKLLGKTEAQKAIDAFESPDTFNLPAGKTLWRMSNAISWIGGQAEETERKLELLRIAGSVLETAA